MKTCSIRTKRYQLFARTINKYPLNIMSVIQQTVGITFIMLTFEIWQIHGFGRISLTTYFLGVISFISSSFCSIKNRDRNKSIEKNTILLIALEVLILFFFYRNYLIILKSIGLTNIALLIMGLIVVLLMHIIQVLYSICKYGIFLNRASIVTFFNFTVCIMLTFILSIECFNIWPRWDSYSYYNAMEKLSAANIFQAGNDGVIVCGHISNSFSLISLLFSSIPYISNLNALYLCNMVLMFSDLILFYLIFKELIPGKKYYLYILIAVCGVFSPYIFGTIGVINPEKLFLTGVLLFVYSLLCKNRLLGIISVFIVCNVKETGVPFVAIMIFLQLIFDFIYRKVRQIDWSYYVCSFLIGLSWLMQYKQIDWSATIKSDVQITYPLMDGADFNKFGFSSIHIKDTLMGALITNLNWIFLLFIIVTFFMIIISIIRKEINIKNIILQNYDKFIIVVGGVVLLAVMCAFVTYHFYRYYTPVYGIVFILGICSLEHILVSIKTHNIIRTGAVLIIAVLLIAQSYITIDPIMLSISPTINTGKHKLAVLPIHMKNFHDPSLMDCANYNRQILYFDKALDQVFSETTESHSIVLLSNEYIAKDGIGSLYCIWGFGYDQIYPQMWGAWDNKGQRRYLSYDENESIDPQYILGGSDISAYTSEYENVYYIEMPWGDTVLKEIKNEGNQAILQKTIDYRGWGLKLYKLLDD